MLDCVVQGSGFVRCPYCKEDDDRVTESRPSAETIRRRRECNRCGRRFTTYERVERHPLLVVKKDGSREPFDRAKLLAGMQRACEKRPVAADALERATDEIERELSDAFEREVPSKAIGELVMRRLRATDPVAYVRFASVYREFKDVGEFMDELRSFVHAPENGVP
jgi:transcriptional repressor NrdR